jgi:hypothetical protein
MQSKTESLNEEERIVGEGVFKGLFSAVDSGCPSRRILLLSLLS